MKTLAYRLATTSALALLVSTALLSATAFAEEHMSPMTRAMIAKGAAGMPGTQSGEPPFAMQPLAMQQQAAVPTNQQQPMVTPPAKPATQATTSPVVIPPRHWVTSSAEVSKVQQALIDHGIGVKVDGLMGPETRAALRFYQSKNHLAVTGRIDLATLETLNVS